MGPSITRIGCHIMSFIANQEENKGNGVIPSNLEEGDHMNIIQSTNSENGENKSMISSESEVMGGGITPFENNSNDKQCPDNAQKRDSNTSTIPQLESNTLDVNGNNSSVGLVVSPPSMTVPLSSSYTSESIITPNGQEEGGTDKECVLSQNIPNTQGVCDDSDNQKSIQPIYPSQSSQIVNPSPSNISTSQKMTGSLPPPPNPAL